MNGENFVHMAGFIKYPKYAIVGQNNSPMFKASLALPMEGRHQYVKVAAWYDIAEALSEVSANTFIKIHGHVEESSYQGACRSCGAKEKKYWTEVIIDNFTIIETEI